MAGEESNLYRMATLRIAPLCFTAFTLALLALAGTAASAQEKPSNRDEIVHVLNRITYGPRVGDVEAVEKMGLQAYIQQQLHPESIDDSAVEQQLGRFRSCLKMSGRGIVPISISTSVSSKKQLEKHARSWPI